MKKLRVQNLLLLVVSYIFYGWWDWRFLTLIIFSSFIDYFCGIYIEKSKDTLFFDTPYHLNGKEVYKRTLIVGDLLK